jgi:hypothetical protein
LALTVSTVRCQADVIPQFLDPSGNPCGVDIECYAFPETLANNGGSGAVSLAIVNTGPFQIRVTNIELFYSHFGFDVANDAIGQPYLPNLGCETIMNPGIANACITQVSFAILDNDPFDQIDPSPDAGLWHIEAFIDWVSGDDVSGVGSGQSVVVGVYDPVTPLPAALPLFASGLGIIGLIAKRRKRRNIAALAST